MLSQNVNRKIQNNNAKLKSRGVKVRSNQVSLDIIDFINDLPNKRAFWTISDQLLRSVTSFGANITEAQASSSKREFIKFYEIALKSANESKYWPSLLRDAYPEIAERSDALLNETTLISNMLGASVLTLKGKTKF